MRLLLAVLCALPLVAAGPVITYSKSFPGSKPEFVQITLDKEGNAVYKEAPDDDQPVKIRLAPQETAEIFALADKLEHFRRPLESGLNVAKMGLKTFRFEDGAEKHEAKFNYSLDEDAKLLLDWFERITESEQHFFNLERSVRYDKLGVHKALLQLEASFDRKRLLALDQFLPLLERVVKNESFLNMARERASKLVEAFRPTKAE